MRGGLLSYIRYESDTKPDSVFWRFARRAVYGSVDDYIDASGEPEAMRDRMDAAWERWVQQSPKVQQSDPAAVAHVRASHADPPRGARHA